MKERIIRKKDFFDGKTVYMTGLFLVLAGLLTAVLFKNPDAGTGTSEKVTEYLLSTASELEEKGAYRGALDIYQSYLASNPGLSQNERAGIYFRMARIAGEKIADYETAQKYSILVKNIVDPESSVFKENQRLLVSWLERSGKSIDAVNELKNTTLDKGISKGGTIIAEINGNPVYRSDFDKAYEQVPEHMRKSIDKKAYLQQFVFRKLAVDAGRRENLHKQEKVVQQLKQIEDELVFKTYIESKTTDMSKLPADDVQNYYKANPDKFTEPSFRDARIAVLEKKDSIPDWEKAKNYKVMPGSDFIPGIGNVPGLSQELFRKSEGQTTEVISAENGKFYLGRVDSVVPERLRTFEESRNNAYQMYYRDKMEKELKEMYEKLSRSGDVKVYEDRIE